VEVFTKFHCFCIWSWPCFQAKLYFPMFGFYLYSSFFCSIVVFLLGLLERSWSNFRLLCNVLLLWIKFNLKKKTCLLRVITQPPPFITCTKHFSLIELKGLMCQVEFPSLAIKWLKFLDFHIPSDVSPIKSLQI
jgi:hypothetical protein